MSTISNAPIGITDLRRSAYVGGGRDVTIQDACWPDHAEEFVEVRLQFKNSGGAKENSNKYSEEFTPLKTLDLLWETRTLLDGSPGLSPGINYLLY